MAVPDPNAYTPIFSKGVEIGVILWFMWRLEGILKLVIRQLQLNTRATTLAIIGNPGYAAQATREAETIAKETEAKDELTPAV